ncbi:MAG: DNA-binding response regulator [Arcobacter sp.]|nr:MAG: DNA-binding response regulator [Arcobacter sp.]
MLRILIYLSDLGLTHQTLREIRKISSTPAIYLTAMNDLDHVKEGYKAGCNDYVRKPFLFEELELRINQLIHNECMDNISINENYSYNLCNMQLFYKNKSIDLNGQEKELLYILVKNIGNTINPDIIKDYVWEEKNICDNTLRTTIKKLRSKLEDNFITNVRNVGYKIEKYD